jgi:hypothetical protein
MGNSNTLFVSLIWGSIGLGMAIYGKKQGSLVPLFGGIALMAVSYVVSSPLFMSLISLAVIGGIFLLRKWS